MPSAQLQNAVLFRIRISNQAVVLLNHLAILSLKRWNSAGGNGVGRLAFLFSEACQLFNLFGVSTILLIVLLRFVILAFPPLIEIEIVIKLPPACAAGIVRASVRRMPIATTVATA